MSARPEPANPTQTTKTRFAASPEEIAALFYLNPEPFLVVNAKTLEILACNAGSTRELGYAEAELVGRKVTSFFSAAEITRLGRLLVEGRAAGPLLGRSAWSLSRRSGAPVRFEVSPQSLRYGGAEAVLLFRTIEGRPTPQSIGARSAGGEPGLAQFAFSAFHDLKEPLHFVTGYLRLLKERSPGQLDSEGQEFLNYAVQGTERIQALVMALLEYFRMGAQPLSPEPVALEEVLRETLETLQLRSQGAGAVITHDALPILLADRLQMTRLLQNLLSNALKFHGPQTPTIHIGARREQGSWHLWVGDNGIGIAAKDLQRVFEPFTRLHSQDEYPGTGLGLSTCKRIVELHSGRIWLESELGRGTTVHFTLPEA